LHGLQVGVASYLMSLVQKENSDAIAGLFDVTGFWDAVAADPFSRSEWREAIRMAPMMKEGFFTVLSRPDGIANAERYLNEDPRLARCFKE
jgi:glycerol-1-phosphate dehydrogenase [NAD(P)+]